MSLATWKKKFYATPASSVRGRVNCVKHSLRKWRGLRKSNLRAHDILQDYKNIYGIAGECLTIDEVSCALCQQYVDDSALAQRCIRCPLSKTLDDRRCDWKEDSPYGKWLETGDALPMIRALERTLKRLEQEAKK